MTESSLAKILIFTCGFCIFLQATEALYLGPLVENIDRFFPAYLIGDVSYIRDSNTDFPKIEVIFLVICQSCSLNRVSSVHNNQMDFRIFDTSFLLS